MRLLSMLRGILADLKVCSAKDYIYYNCLAKNIKFDSADSRIRNLSKPSICLEPDAVVEIAGILNLNTAYPHKSQKNAVLKVDQNGKLEVHGIFQAYYDTEIWVYPKGKLTLGHGYINAGTQLRCMERITIGDGCAIGRNVLIMDFDAHEITYENGTKNRITAPIEIGKHVWIGAGATILKGVTIGDNAIVGAGSIVTRDVPANTIVAGNPARIIRENIQWR